MKYKVWLVLEKCTKVPKEIKKFNRDYKVVMYQRRLKSLTEITKCDGITNYNGKHSVVHLHLLLVDS